MESTTLRKRQRDIEAFVDALGRFLAVMEREPVGFMGDARWIPRAGQETEATRLRFEVDRLAGRAAHALASAGSFVEWKPRGTFQTQPVSPAQAWATILDPDPMFGPDVILACCNQALGVLDMRAEAAEGKERSPVHQAKARLPKVSAGPVRRHLGMVAKVAGGIAGALLVAFLTYVFGWS